jgi:hypothetical protein
VEQLKPTKAAQARSKEISDLVGTSPEELQAWQAVLTRWLERDHNENLVENLISRYKKELADLKPKKTGQGGQGPKPGNGRQSKGNTFRRPQQAYSEEDRKRKEDEARRRLEEKRSGHAHA